MHTLALKSLSSLNTLAPGRSKQTEKNQSWPQTQEITAEVRQRVWTHLHSQLHSQGDRPTSSLAGVLLTATPLAGTDQPSASPPGARQHDQRSELPDTEPGGVCDWSTTHLCVLIPKFTNMFFPIQSSLFSLTASLFAL